MTCTPNCTHCEPALQISPAPTMEHYHGWLALQHAPPGPITLSADQRDHVVALISNCLGVLVAHEQRPAASTNGSQIFRRQPGDSDEEHRERILNSLNGLKIT